jgi:PKD repeat protein
MGHGQRVLGGFVATCVAVAALVAGVVGATSASATSTTLDAKTLVHGSTALTAVQLQDSSLLGVSVAARGLTGTIDWQQPTTVSTRYDTDSVKQGHSPDPVDTLSRTMPGSMVGNFALADLGLVVPGLPFTLDIGTIGLSTFGNCDLAYSGATYTCHLDGVSTPIVDAAPGLYVDAKLAADVTVTPQALTTLRTAAFNGTPAGTANLALSETATTDSLGVSCSVNAGDHLTYGLGTLTTTPGVTIAASLDLAVGTSIANPDYPATDPSPILYLPPAVAPSFAFAPVSTTFPMSGSGTDADLGVVLADDAPVTADAAGPYHGTEGDPITFDGAATAGCRTPSLHWELSDGGSADGATPSHTFADDGTYTGTLTATDGARSATSEFTVTVANAAPTADAGADTSAGVGVPVAFAGAATDPSPVDQASLRYSWDFGDGSPNATGADASHAYTSGGTYTATLTACDKDGECGSDTRQVSVASTQRSWIIYYGDLVGRTGRTSDLRAILLDGDGPLAGREVTFTVGSQTVAATTDARGIASTTLRITQRMGLRLVTASWRQGDAQHTGSSMTLPFFVLPR